jgi:hypothetical protein
MATPIQPVESHPLSVEELRKKRATAVDWGQLPPLTTSLEISDRGPLPIFFRKRSRLEMDAAEQMVPVTPQELFMAFVHTQAAWYGMTVQFAALPVPGMPGQPNGPAGPASPSTPAA